MPIHLIAVALATALVLGGCSGGDDEARKEHIWKDQTEALDKARSAEDQIRRAFSRRDEEMERQNR